MSSASVGLLSLHFMLCGRLVLPCFTRIACLASCLFILQPILVEYIIIYLVRVMTMLRSAALRYRRDGAAILRGVLDAGEVDALRQGIEWNLRNPGPLGANASRDDDPGRFFEDFCRWRDVEAYRKIIFDSALPEISAALMGSKTARLYHDHLLVKEARTKQPTPFHQDQPYYNIEGRQNVSFWIPVDPVPLESSLRFVRGSHLDGTWYLPRTFQSEQAKWFPEGELADVPDEDTFDEDDILSWALEPGDAIAFHMLALHGSDGSTSLRRAFSVRVMGDDVVHAPRPWKTSPQFEGLADELSPGVPMDHDLFPVMHPRQEKSTVMI